MIIKTTWAPVKLYRTGNDRYIYYHASSLGRKNWSSLSLRLGLEVCRCAFQISQLSKCLRRFCNIQATTSSSRITSLTKELSVIIIWLKRAVECEGNRINWCRFFLPERKSEGSAFSVTRVSRSLPIDILGKRMVLSSLRVTKKAHELKFGSFHHQLPIEALPPDVNSSSILWWNVSYNNYNYKRYTWITH